jgi:hypothetical protein
VQSAYYEGFACARMGWHMLMNPYRNEIHLIMKNKAEADAKLYEWAIAWDLGYVMGDEHQKRSGRPAGLRRLIPT